jgi:hypothetical protein
MLHTESEDKKSRHTNIVNDFLLRHAGVPHTLLPLPEYLARNLDGDNELCDHRKKRANWTKEDTNKFYNICVDLIQEHRLKQRQGDWKT